MKRKLGGYSPGMPRDNRREGKSLNNVGDSHLFFSFRRL